MKCIFFAILAVIFPAFGSSAEFDSTIHVQLGTQYPEETSFMKFTGNLYDFIPDSEVMWVVSPKIYLNPSIPVDFSMSAGLKYPVGPIVAGYHCFGHFHNFGDFPVNQYGHTWEILHECMEARVNYYHKASGVFPISSGIKSSARLDGEFVFKFPAAAITVGPVYQMADYKWGFLARVALLFNVCEMGVEVNLSPGGSAMTSLFTTFKFPNKTKPRIAPRGNSSYHYTNLVIEGATSYSATSFDMVKNLGDQDDSETQ